ncbi:hypothetical protein L9F63_014951 [Diploptera punctata]|uniref:Ionotropic glutamate receptor C-terminal domain-containing protein n=1 Tax=Diploptera punctata TaxID=6984 RepID=A0AAD8A910_DIPPU|nr:hypothetical protein L9F63_014951 [Diploptera punctata]
MTHTSGHYHPDFETARPDYLIQGVVDDMDYIAKHFITFPHVFTQLRWYVPCPKKNFIHGHFYKVFEPTLWIFLFLMFIGSTLITVLIHKLSFEESKRSRSTSYNLYCIWAAITSVAAPEMPQTITRRIIFLMWICFSLVLSTIFQSFFTSFLIQPGVEKEISNILELFKSNLAIYSSNVTIFSWIVGLPDDFKDLINSPKINLKFTVNPFESFCKIEQSAMVAFDLDMNADFRTYYLKGLEPCSFAFYSHSMYFLNFETNSPYYEAYNSKLMQYFEGGLLDQLINKFNSSRLVPPQLLDNLRKKLRLDHGENDEFFVLNIQHLKYVFILLVCGNSVSFVVFIAEIIFFKIKTWFVSNN